MSEASRLAMQTVAQTSREALTGTAGGVKMLMLSNFEDAQEHCWEALRLSLSRSLEPFGWSATLHYGFRRIWISGSSPSGGQLHLEVQDGALVLQTAWKPRRRPLEHSSSVDIQLPDGLLSVLDPKTT
jgi:hypothetical protein